VALTYALLDPVMTVARPAAAFATAAAAGLAENLFSDGGEAGQIVPDLSCPVDGCCDGLDCPADEHRVHHSFAEKVWAGFRFALDDLWGDIAIWFLAGLLLAGVIATIVPTEITSRYLGGGLPAMLIMLVVGIPLYICATASTPIAAALVLKGVSPGAALVFLLAGPATNVTSLTVVVGILGKRATGIYLAALAVCAIVFGLVLDQVYILFGASPQALAGQAAQVIPVWAQTVGAFILLALSAKPVYRMIQGTPPTK
jgi:uncharacterized membrane protein YraQ (UPF0718 family)